MVELCTAILWMTVSPPLAQKVPAFTDIHQSHADSLPIAVDGAEYPELIPDNVAYSHFIMATAELDIPSVEHTDRRDALLRRVGFSARDQAAFVSATAGLREELGLNTREMTRLSDVDSDLSAVRSQRDSLLEAARTRVLRTLTVEGAALLHQFVTEHVKRHIIIYGDLPR
jgi:hypothetical protein